MLRALGVDFGDVRVGLAVSDELNMLAHPLETIDVRKTPPIARIAEVAAAKNAGVVVVGMPRNMDGSHGPAAAKATEFAAQLRAALPACRVVTWDERLTTVSAQRSLREAGRNARQQKSIIDQAAAQIILQGWMDSQAGGIDLDPPPCA
jgi:putative Holliday junction resolvase